VLRGVKPSRGSRSYLQLNGSIPDREIPTQSGQQYIWASGQGKLCFLPPLVMLRVNLLLAADAARQKPSMLWLLMLPPTASKSFRLVLQAR